MCTLFHPDVHSIRTNTWSKDWQFWAKRFCFKIYFFAPDVHFQLKLNFCNTENNTKKNNTVLPVTICQKEVHKILTGSEKMPNFCKRPCTSTLFSWHALKTHVYIQALNSVSTQIKHKFHPFSNLFTMFNHLFDVNTP